MLELDWSGFWIGSGFALEVSVFGVDSGFWSGFGEDSGVGVDSGLGVDLE